MGKEKDRKIVHIQRNEETVDDFVSAVGKAEEDFFESPSDSDQINEEDPDIIENEGLGGIGSLSSKKLDRDKSFF